MTSNEFKRDDLLFSLCGLNCSLCPMFIRGGCTGCREGSSCYLICEFAPCSIEHGNIDYCFECDEYPCEKYDGVDLYDSLISHKNQLKDMEKAKTIGIENYRAEQRVKKGILNRLLNEYDAGHSDVFFCLAVNLMEVNDLNKIVNEADELTKNMNLDEKSSFMKDALNNWAVKRNISLKLRH
ncbi:DUF3795 domain-containing protein [Methanobrevibacter sp.]|uniref:DUF3795 domain-containing protein n=1 Tax=Methanobrevibacter sp. TaxID=66852 RepID=UPI0038903D27